MIKFFRNLRQSMISQNRVSKYLLYAIGEIILVVIGILLALQINNWNQNRIESREEFKALKNLKEDFTNNKKLLEEASLECKNGITASLQMLEYTGTKPKPESEEIFNDIINGIFVDAGYFPFNSSLDELVNSGKLVIIKNDELRKLMTSWKPQIERVATSYDETVKYEQYLNEYVLANGSWLNADKYIKVQRSVTFPESGFSSDNRELLSELEFENIVENVAIGLDNHLTFLKQTSILLEEILQLIDKEITDFPEMGFE